MTAATGTLLLFFTGIVAFVPSIDRTSLTAYLVNVDGHEQFLRIPDGSFDAAGSGCPVVSADGYKCEDDGGYCKCPLEGINVIVETKPGKELPRTPPGVLPDDANAGKIDWIVNLEHVHPAAARASATKLGKNTGGRIAFGWSDAATCAFDEIKYEKDGKEWRRIYAMTFDVALSRDPVQAVPELVVFKSETPRQKVLIQLEKAEAIVANLELSCLDETSCPVLIANAMTGNRSCPSCDPCTEPSRDDGEHFRHYARLAKGYTGSGVAPVRLCGDNDHKDLDYEFPRICAAGLPLADKVFTIGDRIICPTVGMYPY